jgi:DNA-binding PadR family transcriptional regulator
MKDDPAGYLPLSPATLHILLALAGEDLHGYGIMQEVMRQSEGRYKLGPGTLYDNIQRLTAQGLVQEVARRTDSARNDDPRRRYYRLTSSGRGVLSAEISRLETVVRDGKLRVQSAKPRRA